MDTPSQTYTCPMHPEIRSAAAGRCPKCGMPLVPVDEHKTVRAVDKVAASRNNYQPLVVVLFMITLVSAIVSWGSRGADERGLAGLLTNFMTGFFLVFGSFKLMDLKGFAQGYSTYDLLAERWFAYGYIYPFIELAFGFLMLVNYHPNWLLWTEFVVMAFSGLGVARKLARHEVFECACLGTFLKVPLSSVTIMEDFGMAFLALVLIFLS